MYRGNQACLTPHIWLSRIDKLDYPDQLVFDLDPSGDSFESVKAAAQSLKELHGQLGLPAYLKTTGSRGLHVAVPLKRSEGFDSVRAFARELAKVVVSQEPGQRTLEQRKSMRRGLCSWTRTGTPMRKRWPLLTPCGPAVALLCRSRLIGMNSGEGTFGRMG
jgi:bifunctional non-homologous end joining protein LigD